MSIKRRKIIRTTSDSENASVYIVRYSKVGYEEGVQALLLTLKYSD